MLSIELLWLFQTAAFSLHEIQHSRGAAAIRPRGNFPPGRSIPAEKFVHTRERQMLGQDKVRTDVGLEIEFQKVVDVHLDSGELQFLLPGNGAPA